MNHNYNVHRLILDPCCLVSNLESNTTNAPKREAAGTAFIRLAFACDGEMKRGNRLGVRGLWCGVEISLVDAGFHLPAVATDNSRLRKEDQP